MAASVFGIITPHPPIMVPGVGGSRAEVTRASLDALAAGRHALANFAPETLVVMSPHAPALSDAIAVDDSDRLEGTLAEFGDPTPHRWTGDSALAHALIAELEMHGVPAVARSADARLRAGWLDHAVLVPLSFLDPVQQYALVVISLSYLPYERHRAVGEALRAAVGRTGRRVAFVASGDLSHRLTTDAPAGYSPRASSLDEAIVGLVEQGRLSQLASIDAGLVEAGGECGLRSFIALGGFAGDDPVPTRVLAYEGPWGVGYLTALVGNDALRACDDRGLTTAQRGSKGGTAGQQESEIVLLARRSIESYVRHGHGLEGPQLDDSEYPARAGTFVSLHRDDQLRGCIGTILPTHDTLANEVAANAVEAATRDPRFPPLQPEELDDLEVKVDVLHAPESCTIDDLDPSRYGVIVTSGWRRGLLLPDLEGVDDVETQLDIVAKKAGIRPGEPCSYERFLVDRYT
jgi:AmmeMemoRadiSam system protein A